MEDDQIQCSKPDINHVFDSIALTEQRIAEVGFEEGYRSGLSEGEIEGFHLGYHRGSELGAEIGYYQGVVETWIALHAKKENSVSEKAYLTLLKVRDMIKQCPKSNEENVNFTELTDQIRSLFRRACSLLKTSGLYPETSKLSF